MTQRPRYERQTCCIIGCRRTSRLFPGEWICGEHWRMVDREVKRIRTKILKKRIRDWEQAKAMLDAVRAECAASTVRPVPQELFDRLKLRSANIQAARRAYDATVDLFWRRMKRQATERALGISA